MAREKWKPGQVRYELHTRDTFVVLSKWKGHKHGPWWNARTLECGFDECDDEHHGPHYAEFYETDLLEDA